jgi:hypothetical protein
MAEQFVDGVTSGRRGIGDIGQVEQRRERIGFHAGDGTSHEPCRISWPMAHEIPHTSEREPATAPA